MRGVVVVGLALAVTAAATDRPRVVPAVAVVESDAIVVGRLPMPDPLATTVELDIRTVLYGTVPTGPLQVHLENRMWGARASNSIVARLDRRGGEWYVLEAMADSPANRDAWRARGAAAPAWPEPVDGWAAVLVLEDAEVAPGDQVNGWVVYRNDSDTAAVFRYREWPPEAHTRWELTVTRDGEAVAPRPHPHLTADEITDYFSKHPNNFELPLEPGQTFAFPLLRLNSAEAGWGYKQRIGFQYWPMDTPGTYAITARDQAFEGRAPLTTPPVELTVTAKGD